jgi:arylsulfatase A-like enzyme
MADDQGWGDMAYNGHPILKTPNFDSMATSSLRFDRFYAAAPVCSPTRGSVMTGRHPNRFGCFRWGYTLRPQEITIAEALKEAGYVTGHFGKWHLGSVCKGSPVNPGASGFDEWFSAPNFFDNDPILSRKGIAIQTQGESSLVTVDAAIDFIRTQSKEANPFIAVVWFGSPHKPHQALEQDRAQYSDQSENFQHFYGEITAMDRAFGKLRQELRTLGIHENTILWYCSDNGGLPEVGTTGGRARKGQVYEGGLRVPALLEWPARITNPKTNSVPCSTSDIYPTILEIVGLNMKNQPPLDGISLVPLLEGKMNKRPNAMGFWYPPTKGIPTPSKPWMSELLQAQKEGRDVADSSRLRLDAGDISKQYPEDDFPGHSAWLDWPWKLHRIQKENSEIIWELYNLIEDPEESQDMVVERSKRAEAMRSDLENWLGSVVHSLNGKDYQ